MPPALPERDQIIELLAPLEPAENVLLDLLRPHVNDDLLAEISEADYGMDAPEHFEALQRIRDTGEIPASMAWVPGEVLELIRHSDPENPEHKPGSTGHGGHLMRAWCCAVLIRALIDPEHEKDHLAENATVGGLTASAIALGEEFCRPALQLLCCRAPWAYEPDGERPFYSFAILLLVTHLGIDSEDGQYLRDLAEWVIAEEDHVRANGVLPEDHLQWLLGVTFYTSGYATWRQMARTILLNPARPHPRLADSILRDLGRRIVEPPC